MSWNAGTIPISTIATRLKCLYFQFCVPLSIPQRTLLFSLSISRHDRCLVTYSCAYSHGVTQRVWCLRNASQAPALRLGTGTTAGPTFVGHRAVELQETALFCHGPFTAHWTSLFIVVILSTSFTLYGYRDMYSWEYECAFSIYRPENKIYCLLVIQSIYECFVINDEWT